MSIEEWYRKMMGLKKNFMMLGYFVFRTHMSRKMSIMLEDGHRLVFKRED